MTTTRTWFQRTPRLTAALGLKSNSAFLTARSVVIVRGLGTGLVCLSGFSSLAAFAAGVGFGWMCSTSGGVVGFVYS